MCIASVGQTISYSPYSAYGVGILKEKTSALNRGMAETGIAVRDNFNLNALNPASYTSIQTVTQISEFGLYLEKDKLSSTKTTQTSSIGNLTAINLWFRATKWWGSTIGITPYSAVNYNIAATKIFDESSNEVNYSGKGGLTQYYFGNGFQLNKNLSVGLNLSYILGKIEKNETILSGEYSGLSLSNSTYLNRPSIDFGTQYSFFFKDNRSLTMGLTYNNKLRLNTTRDTYVTQNSLQDSIYTSKDNIEDYVIPSNLGLGLAYQTHYHTIAIDFKNKKWADASLDYGLKLKNTMRFSVGYEYKGKQTTSNTASFISLRAGAFMQNHYILLNNRPFNDFGFSLGAGIPVSGNRGQINILYNYNSLGTTQKNLILQSSQILVIDIILRDIWGVRRKFD